MEKNICLSRMLKSVIFWTWLFGLVFAFDKHVHFKLKQKNIKLNTQIIKWQPEKHKKPSLFQVLPSVASLKQRLQELQGHLSGDKTRQKLKTKEKWMFISLIRLLTLFCTQSLRKRVARVGEWPWLCSAGAHKSRSSKAPRISSLSRTPLSPKQSTQYPDPAEHALPRAGPGTAQRQPLPQTRREDLMPSSPEAGSYHPQEVPLLFGFITCKQN